MIVTHNSAENRFELTIDGHLAELDYTMMGDIIIFTHTGVPPEIREHRPHMSKCEPSSTALRIPSGIEIR